MDKYNCEDIEQILAKGKELRKSLRHHILLYSFSDSDRVSLINACDALDTFYDELEKNKS